MTGLTVILGLGMVLGGFAIAGAASRAERSRIEDTRRRLHDIERALALYTTAHGSCPEVLESLYTHNYLKRSRLRDPWGGSLDYQCITEPRSRRMRLGSAGADQTFGTADDIRIRSTWRLSPEISARLSRRR